MSTPIHPNKPPRTRFMPLISTGLLALFALPLQGCQQISNPFQTQAPSSAELIDGPPERTIRAHEVVAATPKYEPRSRYGNHSPYVVFGQQYEVMEGDDRLIEEGYASWYGTKFHGKRTSSWEPYNMYGMTAAHRALPLPTYVKVTNLENKRSTIVKVNDRGPFHSDRIIDLSYAAAVKLGFVNQGTAKVRIESIPMSSLRPQQKPSAQLASASPSSHVQPTQNSAAQRLAQQRSRTQRPAERLYVQVGAYSERARALAMQEALQEWLTFPISLKKNPTSGLYRVKIGPLNSSVQAQTVNQLLDKEFGISSPMLVWN